MKNVQKIDLGLTGYDELFANDEERKVNKLPLIFDIPISEIDDFPDHPFKVKIDEDMDQLVQSIKERGIITPVTLRPKEDGRYEIVSGHRRKKACELAGLDTVKAEVREMNRDEAIILMVESNLQRSTILPSEKAFSYKMRLEAMNRQGQRTDLTSVPVAQKSTSREQLGKEVGESQDQVRRYIRLTQLIQPLLDLVDEEAGGAPSFGLSLATVRLAAAGRPHHPARQRESGGGYLHLCDREHLRQLPLSACGGQAEVHRPDHDLQEPCSLRRGY